MAKSKANHIKNALQDKTMCFPNGQTEKLLEVFAIEDFTVSDNDSIFIKHAPLLRIAKQKMGIVSREVIVAQVPDTKNDWNATVQVQYTFANGVVWNAIADCRQKTAPKGFTNYTIALAETRASARCLREAMGVEICSAEEVIDTDNLNQIKVSDKTPISDIQVAALEKFILEGKTSLVSIGEILDKPVLEIQDLTRLEAEQLLDVLNS